MIKRILIANRGEIACRIARTCKLLGIDAVAVYSDVDRESRHVREIGHAVAIGGSNAADSYLNIDNVIKAAKDSGCDAVHPGYGFLSENPDFAEALERENLIFIGPRADSLRRFGDKSAAKVEAQKASVPIILGSDGKLTDTVEILKLVNTMQLPLMLKAAAGGGGKGMRIIKSLDNIEADIDAAKSEALRSFSDDALLVEQYIDKARHVEVQIAGDGEGNVIHLFERECSLQRRHQKVLEEAPAIFLDSALRQKLLADACRLGEQVKYRGLGTVEFLVQGNNYYFLEVNPRLQVEHPVTESITGLDLVELQIRIANSFGLGLKQANIKACGHAIEVRLYAESPEQNFMPATGTIQHVAFPEEHLRVESGVNSGDQVSSFYDPMIAKLISTSKNRQQALERLQKGMDETILFGIDNNRNFLQQLLRQPDVESDNIDTRLLDRWLLNYSDNALITQVDKRAAMAAALWLNQFRQVESKNPWNSNGAFNYWTLSSPSDTPIYSIDLHQDDEQWRIAFIRVDEQNRITLMVNETLVSLRLTSTGDNAFLAEFDDVRIPLTAMLSDASINIHADTQQSTYEVIPVVRDKQGGTEGENSVKAPMMGEIIKVVVAEGEQVEEGDLLVVMESMKMQLRIEAIRAGVVSHIHCKAGDNVARGAVVVEVSGTSNE